MKAKTVVIALLVALTLATGVGSAAAPVDAAGEDCSDCTPWRTADLSTAEEPCYDCTPWMPVNSSSDERCMDCDPWREAP